jgi:hypothetical protein
MYVLGHHEEQGDQMSLKKIAQNVAQHFVKLIKNFYCGEK